MRDDFAHLRHLRRRRAFGHLTGWLCLALGGAILAGIVITPAWIQLKYKQWEQGLVEAHAERQARQVRAYEEFTEALAASEPALLQRLAYAQLRMKPADGELVVPPDQLAGDMSLLSNRQVIRVADPNGLTAEQAHHLAMIEQWLYEPTPALGRDYPAWQPPRGRVVRLCTGPMRLPLLALAGIFLYLAFLTPDPQVIAALNAAANDDDEAETDAEAKAEADGRRANDEARSIAADADADPSANDHADEDDFAFTPEDDPGAADPAEAAPDEADEQDDVEAVPASDPADQPKRLVA